MLHPRLHHPCDRLWWNQCLGAIQYSNVSLVHKGKASLKSSNELEIILKEITLDGDTSRITAIISQNEDEIGLIKTLDNLSNKSNLTMSLVSDVSVAS